MRFDEINIIGEFKINGLTGSPGQALGLSGSDFTWITVSASSAIDAVGLTGTDYVICQSVNTGNPGADAIANGNRLKSAYATASALYVSNRVSVLITPGDYNFDATPLQLTTTKVDLIGISSDASDVILRGSGDYVLQIINSNTDTALCNVTLATASLYSFDNSGTSSCYLRWDNVIATGNMFSDDNTSYTDLNGDFKNIKVHDSTYAFYTIYGNIDGVYDNIELTDVNSSFYSYDFNLLGTYSNITFSGTIFECFRCGSFINATFENIKTGNIGSFIFIAPSINGRFKNIEVGDVSYSILFSGLGNLDGTFENITIGNVSQNALSTNTGNLTGTFSNIKIGTANNFLYCFGSGTVSGSFNDIESGDLSAFFLSTDNGNISGTFENIKCENIAESIFYTPSGNISGIFKNIEIDGDVSNTGAFYSTTGNISGTFSNIKTKNILGSSFWGRNNLMGTFEDMKFLDGTDFFRSEEQNIEGTFKNIEIGNVTGEVFYSPNGTMSATFSNIEIGNVGDFCFYSANNLSANVENVKIGEVSGDSFKSVSGSVGGIFKNIEIQSTIDTFRSNTTLSGTFENITIGEINNTLGFYCITGMNGTYKNIEVKSGSGNNTLFNSDSASLTGTFDNININAPMFSFLSASADNVIGTFSNITALNTISIGVFNPPDTLGGSLKNITLGTVSGAFGGSNYTAPLEIDNLKMNGYIGSQFNQKIINSFVDARGTGQAAILLYFGAIVERCKFLSDTDIPSINSQDPINAQISFTITNYGITSSITNDIGTPLNIDNPNIT